MKPLLNCTIIISCIFFHVSLHAQCPTVGITLNSQEDVNNFPAGCTTITGTLTIQGSDITDLSPLENITTISKALRIIQNDSLTNLDGLENITTIGAYLRINKNGMLTNLDGLKNLTVVGGYIEIVNNHELTSLEGLHSLTKAEDVLNIIKNYKLTSLKGLDNITSIGKYLLILENNQLTNLEGLESLESIETGLRIQKNAGLNTLEGIDNLSSVGGNINILSNAKLTDLNGLEGLTTNGGFLKITQNPVLTSLHGLKNLASIDGYIKIRKNHALTSLSGLEKIDPESITNLLLTANEELSFCNLPNICEYLSGGGQSNIKKNTGACVSEGAVKTICESLVNISSVEALGDINVDCHTLFEDLELPATVEVTFSDNGIGNMSVIWEESDYNGTAGPHNITGKLVLMGPIANPDNLTAKITVNV